MAAECKTNTKVNKSKFEGVVIDDEIEEVGDGQTVACPSVVSIEQGGHGRRSPATVCMCSHGWAQLLVAECICSQRRRNAAQLPADNFGRSRRMPFCIPQNIDTHNGRLHAGCISALSAPADDLVCLTLIVNYFSGAVSHNPNSLYCMVRVCGRWQNRLYLAVGDGYACLPVAMETGVVIKYKLHIFSDIFQKIYNKF